MAIQAQDRETAPPEQAISASLTPSQVCDLPMDELLDLTDVRIGAPLDLANCERAGLNTEGLFGYLAIREAETILHIRGDADEVAQDGYARYLITQYLGLPTHLFPDVLQHTVLDPPQRRSEL